LIDLGFAPNEFEPCIFISKTANLKIARYVDDILPIGPQHACDEFDNPLKKKFLIVNQGPVSSFLGINIQRKDGTILLNQSDFITELAQHILYNQIGRCRHHYRHRRELRT
jgi:Reverse transcriptase (RNA-dependent DNA polymerase)